MSVTPVGQSSMISARAGRHSHLTLTMAWSVSGLMRLTWSAMWQKPHQQLQQW